MCMYRVWGSGGQCLLVYVLVAQKQKKMGVRYDAPFMQPEAASASSSSSFNCHYRGVFHTTLPLECEVFCSNEGYVVERLGTVF